jgi:hypothetical protein
MNKNYLIRTIFILCLFCGKTALAQLPELMYFQFESAPGGVIPNLAPAATAVGTGGTIVGAHTVGGAGQFGQALISGASTTSDYVNTGWIANLPGDWTLSIWVFIDNVTGTNYFFGDNTAGSFRCFSGGAAGDGIRIAAPFALNLTAATNIKGQNSVIHWVRDATAGKVDVYVNGVFNNTVVWAGTLAGTTGPFRIGGTTTGGFSTKIDEFRLYNRALSAAEIAATWNVNLLTPPVTCNNPMSLSLNSATTTTADLSWGIVSSATSYDYIVSTSATPPTTGFLNTTGTTYTATGLTASTTYYLHVRSVCSPTASSSWSTLSFKTKDPCSEPTPFKFVDITDKSVKLQWTGLPAATSYEYSIDTLRPLPATGYSLTTNTDVSITDLKSDKWYYVYIRSNCGTGVNSGWYLDSFKTRRTCASPDVKITNVNVNHAVVYWMPVPYASTYEYAINNSADVPTEGTKISVTSSYASALKDGVEYYYHVRCNCKEGDYASNSAWTTANFKTFPTGINSTQQNTFKVDAYPNPAHDRVAIKVDGGSANGKITVQDVSGKILKTQSVTGNITYMDMEHVAAGIYLIKYTDDANTEVIRINKQ